MPNLPMAGSARAHVVGVRTVSIHGDIYYDATVLLDEGPAPAGAEPRGKPVALRLAKHLCSRPPIAGDQMRLSFLMGQVHGAEFLHPAEA